MAPEPSTLELLRSRLTDLEARQRATGGASDARFRRRFFGRMPSASSQPSASSARGGVRARRLAPEARPVCSPRGPWAGVPVEELESIDLLDVRWLDAAGYERMVNDPAWIASVEARIEAPEELPCDAHAAEAISIDAS
ncbi:hypothetical protein, partial [Terrabacter terrigena]